MTDAEVGTRLPGKTAQQLMAVLLGVWVLYVCLMLALPAGLARRELLADIAYLPFSALSSSLWWVAARHTTDVRQRMGFRLLCASQLFGVANQITWVMSSAGIIAGESPAFEIAGLATTVCMAAGLLYLVPGRSSASGTPVLPVIDAILLAVGSFSIGWHWVGMPVLQSGTESARDFVWLASVASGDFFTALLALSAWAFAGQRLRSDAALVLAAGLGMTALMDLLLEMQTLAGTYHSGGGVDMVFGASIVLQGAAAFLVLRPERTGTAAAGLRRAMMMRLLLPAIGTAAIVVPIIAQAFRPVAGPERFMPAALLLLYMGLILLRFLMMERAAERSLTERLVIERDLRLSQQFESFGRYAASVAHDMSNLLASLTAQVHLMRLLGVRGEKVADHASELERTIASGTTLTRRLLQMSRGGQASVEPVDLTRSVRNMAMTVSNLLPNDVYLAVECAPEPVVVGLRPGDADQLLLNLVVNARDALTRGGHITVRLQSVDRVAQLEVIDDGDGIPPELLSRIFDPFFTTRPDRGGTGLGLSTVKSIVTQSMGTVDVASNATRGTTFTVRFPLVDVFAA